MSSDSGPTLWDVELGHEISAKAIAAVQSHPRFSEACRGSIAEPLVLIKNDTVFHANFRDIGRMVLGTLALYLHASGGLTHRRLCEISSSGGSLSSGRATAILLRLRMIGYVKGLARRSNGSARLYVPSQKMIDAFRNRVRVELRGLALLDPQMADFIDMFEDDETFFRLYRLMGEQMMNAAHLRRTDLVALESLTTRDAGMLIIYALFEAADHGGAFPAAGAVKVSLAALARRFGVSRTHVLRLLRDAEKLGFITREPGGDYGVITPKLRDDFATFHAIIMVTLGAMVNRVRAEIASGAPLHEPLPLSA